MNTKRIKTVILLALVLSMKSALVLAQPREGHQDPPPVPDAIETNKMVTVLASELSLTQEQKDKLNTLFTAHFKVVKEKLYTEKIATEKHHREMEKLRTDFESQINRILKPEQQKKFIEFQKCKPRPKTDVKTGHNNLNNTDKEEFT